MTHTAKHTPGPRHVRPDYGKDNVYRLWDENDNYHDDTSPEAMDANAALIAAAPVMYEALKAAYKLLREWTPSGEDNQGEVEGLIEAALAQAEGKQ